MQTEKHKITVDERTEVSSIWLMPDNYRAVLIIAHGAGNDMHSEFIRFLHRNFAEQGMLTVKFNFPYTERGKKAPDRAPTLEATWLAVIEAVREKTRCRPKQLFISGKSMGGRYASIIASRQIELGGLLFFGYPLHAPGKPDKVRAEHLAAIQCPMLFIQGTRDTLCNMEKLREVLAPLRSTATLHTIAGGDHSFRVLKRLNRPEAEVWNEIVHTGSQWIRERL